MKELRDFLIERLEEQIRRAKMTEFSERYANLGPIERKQARKALEREVAAQLTRIYGRVWSKGKIAVKASKMVDATMRAEKAHLN